MLNIQNLSFSYNTGKSSFKVLDKICLNFKQGFNIILGPNGAGKSTLLKCIFGLLKSEGDIFYNNINLSKMKIDKIINIMSYLPQMDGDSSSLRVIEAVLLGLLPDLGYKVSDENLNIVMQTLSSLNIENLAARKVSELSGGQRKLVYIAQTLVRRPDIILMDEPTNSLDLQKQLELFSLLKDIIKKQKISLITALHDLNLAARYGDHIAVIDCKGTIYSEGVPKEIITEEMLKNVYGVVANINYDKDDIPLVSPVKSVRTMV